MEIRQLSTEDAAAGVQVTQSVGWLHDLDTWKRQIELSGKASFGVFVDGQLVATATAVCYGQVLAWIGLVVTHPDHQRRGYSRRVMETVLEHLITQNIRCIMLDATPLGQPLYASLGFRPVEKIEIWRGLAQVHPLSAPSHIVHTTDLIGVAVNDLQTIVELDAKLFGVSREHLICRLLNDFPRLAWVAMHKEAVVGYVLAKMGAINAIGPWFHPTPEGAEQLFIAALNALAGRQVALNIFESHLHAKIILQKYGFEYQRYCTRMVYGNAAVPAGMALQYSVASLGTG